MTLLFEPYDLAGMLLPNRVVMAPMTRARALNDTPDDLTALYYAQRSGAGLIVSEGAPVSKEARGFLFTPGLFTDEQAAGWRKVTDAVHGAGGRIFAQLWHVGRVSHSSLQPEDKAPVSSSAKRAESSSAYAYRDDGQPGMVPASTPRARNRRGLARYAGLRARRAGGDRRRLRRRRDPRCERLPVRAVRQRRAQRA
jgi:2,4-dienoyl-CoA reductase-like NADH-dependent reductase (Old Yellow Enzyme family)